jgi:hypothetical protein
MTNGQSVASEPVMMLPRGTIRTAGSGEAHVSSRLTTARSITHATPRPAAAN